MIPDVALLQGPAATAEFGARLLRPLARRARGQTEGAMLVLCGSLGAGKSSLARGLLRAAGVAGALPSPTYTLVEPYDVAGLALYHLDLYRLADSSELGLLGWDEIRRQGALAVVEWGEPVAQLADLHLVLEHAGEARRCRVSGGCRNEPSGA